MDRPKIRMITIETNSYPKHIAALLKAFEAIRLGPGKGKNKLVLFEGRFSLQWTGIGARQYDAYTGVYYRTPEPNSTLEQHASLMLYDDRLEIELYTDIPRHWWDYQPIDLRDCDKGKLLASLAKHFEAFSEWGDAGLAMEIHNLELTHFERFNRIFFRGPEDDDV